MDTPSFIGTEWELTAHRNARGEIVPVIPRSRITINFTRDERVHGRGGCNGYNATHHLRGKILTIGNCEVSLMLCHEPKGVMVQEASYLEILRKVTGYALEDNTLILKNEAGEDVAWYKQSQRRRRTPSY